MSKSQIIYKDIAPGAAEDATFTASDAIDFADVSLLADGAETEALATLEANIWVLDGSFSLIDDSTVVPYCSDSISGDDGAFETAPVITVTLGNQYSTTGLSLVFDREYCSAVNIQWYQDETLKADVDFTPDSETYFCQNTVESFDKVIITLNKTALPHRRARIKQIIFGITRYFDMSELRSVSITNEMDLLALTLPICKMRWTLDSRSDVEFMFQLKQPVSAVNDNNLIGVYYIDEFTRSSKSVYSITCQDAFGVLDESTFSGGVYTDKSAQELISEIVGDAFDVTFEVDDTTLTGVLLEQTKRAAIQQVLFAWGAVASTDVQSGIRIFTPSTEPTEIGEDRTYYGVSAKTDAIVTEVQVTAHTYTEDTSGNVDVNGTKYKDTTTVYSVKNPDVTANDKENVVSVASATLVSTDIGQTVAQRVYDFYLRRTTLSSRFVWAGERLGDCVTQPNAWGGTNTGILKRMEIKLSNTVAADSDSVGV